MTLEKSMFGRVGVLGIVTFFFFPVLSSVFIFSRAERAAVLCAELHFELFWRRAHHWRIGVTPPGTTTISESRFGSVLASYQMFLFYVHRQLVQVTELTADPHVEAEVIFSLDFTSKACWTTSQSKTSGQACSSWGHPYCALYPFYKDNRMKEDISVRPSADGTEAHLHQSPTLDVLLLCYDDLVLFLHFIHSAIVLH